MVIFDRVDRLYLHWILFLHDDMQSVTCTLFHDATLGFDMMPHWVPTHLMPHWVSTHLFSNMYIGDNKFVIVLGFELLLVNYVYS